MRISYSPHAQRRMKQRGITELHVLQILERPDYIRKSFEGRKEAGGCIEGRFIRIEFIEEQTYINIITVI